MSCELWHQCLHSKTSEIQPPEQKRGQQVMLMMQSVTLLRVVEIKERLWQKSDF